MIASGRICKIVHNTFILNLLKPFLGCCFDVMNELGVGFLESVYKNALFIAIKEKGFKIEVEKRFEVIFRGRKAGLCVLQISL